MIAARDMAFWIRWIISFRRRGIDPVSGRNAREQELLRQCHHNGSVLKHSLHRNDFYIGRIYAIKPLYNVPYLFDRVTPSRHLQDRQRSRKPRDYIAVNVRHPFDGTIDGTM